MSLSRKIAQNTAIQMGGKMIGTILSLIAAGFLFRYLGDEGYGRYTTIIAFLQIFGILMDFGLYIVLIKHLALIEEKNSAEVNTIFTLRVFSGIIVLGGAPLVAWIASFYSNLYTIEVIQGITLTTLFFLFISLNQLLSAIFQKFLRTDWIALAEFLGKITLLGTTLTVIWAGGSLLWVMSTLVISSAVNFAVNFLASRKYMHLRLYVDWAIVKSVVQEAWPVALSIAFGLLYFKGDTVILTFFESEEVVGWYGAPYKILEVLITFPAMFAGLALPSLTAAWGKKDLVSFTRMLQKSFDALVLFAIPMIAGTVALAPEIVGVIAGDQFENSEQILRILIVATAAIFVGTLFTYLVVALNKQRVMIFGYAFAAITSLAAYLIVIPRYSIIGAAWVTVWSEIAILLIAFSIVLFTSRVKLSLVRFVKGIAAALLMYAFLLALLPTIHALFANSGQLLADVGVLVILVPAGAAIYAIAMIGMKGLSLKDIKEIAQLRS